MTAPLDSKRMISDHALLRWLERVCGFPIEDYRDGLAERLAPVAASGATAFRALEGVYCFRDGVLTTVLTRDMRPSQNARERFERKRVAETRP